MSDTPTPEQQDHIAGLRAAADAGKAALAENDLLKKQLMFADAGIDRTSEIGAMLFDTWQGDDLAALTEKATRLGALKGKDPEPPTPTPDPARAEEDAARARMHELNGAGSTTPPEHGGDHPRSAAIAGYKDALLQGQDPELAAQDAVGKVLAAGLVSRDPRMMFDQEAHKAAGAEADRLYGKPAGV